MLYDVPPRTPVGALGAVGVVGTTTHWTASLFASMIAAMRRGDLAQARAVNARLQSSFGYVNDDECVFPMAIKSLLPLLGVEAGVCRLPLPAAPEGTRERARAVCRELGLVGSRA